jgi:hypothetical protein
LSSVFLFLCQLFKKLLNLVSSQKNYIKLNIIFAHLTNVAKREFLHYTILWIFISLGGLFNDC